jgi:hypothetical protein
VQEIARPMVIMTNDGADYGVGWAGGLVRELATVQFDQKALPAKAKIHFQCVSRRCLNFNGGRMIFRNHCNGVTLFN